MNVKQEYRLEDVFDDLDVNQDQVLEYNEIKTACTYTELLPCDQERVEVLITEVLNSSGSQNESLFTFDVWKESKFAERLLEYYSRRYMYKHEIMGKIIFGFIFFFFFLFHSYNIFWFF